MVKNRPIIDYRTTNISFLKMHTLLKKLHIKNNSFFLYLYDQSLVGVNPYDPTLSPEIQHRVIVEAKRNIWYYLREVVRIPGGSVPVKYELHLGNLSFHYLRLFNHNIYFELPRQCFKSISVAVDHSHLVMFGTANSTCGIFSYDNSMVAENISRIMDIMDHLPVYMRFHELQQKDTGSLDVNGKPVFEYTIKPKSTAKKLTAGVDVTGNKLVGKTPGTTKEQANKVGRGYTMPNQWWDEPCNMKNLAIAVGSASPAFVTAAENAKKNNTRYGLIYSSTPPDTDTPEGMYMLDFFKEKSCLFRPIFFDYYNKLDDVLRKNSKNGFFFISYQWYELGKSVEWYNAQLSGGMGIAELRRDILLKWDKQITGNPYPIELLKHLEDLTTIEHYRDVEIGENYFFRFYCTPTGKGGMDDVLEYIKNNRTIISSDVSGGMGGNRDFSTLTLIDPVTTDLMMEFKANDMNPTAFGRLIEHFIYEYAPKTIVVMERNSYGRTVLTNLMEDPNICMNNILFFPRSKDQELKSIKEDVTGKGIAGIYNVANIRNTLYEDVLNDRVHKNRLLFRSSTIVDQMMSLTRMKNDRIDHKSGHHDDLLMAYIIGLYAITRCRTELVNQFMDMPKLDLYTDRDIEEKSSELGCSISEFLWKLRYNDMKIETTKTYMRPEAMEGEYQDVIDTMNMMNGERNKVQELMGVGNTNNNVYTDQDIDKALGYKETTNKKGGIPVIKGIVDLFR